MNTDYENELLYHFMPVLYLHKDELTSPISIKDYFNNCELCVNGTKENTKKFIY